MAVQDELLALCAELHSSGIKLSYDTILKARGRGSRRDIACSTGMASATRPRACLSLAGHA
ncbi:hypothetical protein DSM109990_03851 (plasmid) [Sulfitobacter dubius]|uniref:Transposase n=1 Tax=Sulfitobacter dubius TaxID=218673 RepID=A0ABY3ZTA4_9RHOB|nr:hypothetical protein DSM109990_03851 [Sulfitobacter dubius]